MNELLIELGQEWLDEQEFHEEAELFFLENEDVLH